MARIISAFTQFLDDQGQPLADGYLKFNESGTNNTDKDIWSDINETIPAANPLKLSGAGRCPNVFGTGSYNIISYHNDGTPYPGAPGAQIEQFDPVGGDSDAGAFADWNALTIYASGDIVTGSDGLYYRSLVESNQNQNPTSSPGQWEEVTINQIWNTNVTYAVGDPAYGSDGRLYVSRTSSNLANNPTTDATNWEPGALTRCIAGADIASATTIDLTAPTTGNSVRITGTTATSAVTMNTGQQMLVVADGAWPLTYHATTNKLNGGVSQTLEAGDIIDYHKDLSGVVHGLITKNDGKSIVETGITLGTEVATTSGTSVTLSSAIPAGTKEIKVMLAGVSTSGTSPMEIRIGDSGGIEATGYVSVASTLGASTTGFRIVGNGDATYVFYGTITLSLEDSASFTWSSEGGISRATAHDGSSGGKSLSAELTQLSITTAGGSDTFDLGAINIQYES